MEAFLYILEVISIITGVLIAVDKILSIMAKHKTKFGEKTQERLVNNYKIIFDKLMPAYLKPIKDEVKEIKEINKDQSKTIELLKANTQELFRQRIEEIYYTYKKERSMPMHIRECLDEKYETYTAAGGNHHIHKLYKRMSKWSTYEAIPEYDIDIEEGEDE
jgi:hypothetical protein